MRETGSVATRLARMIDNGGPIPLSLFMAMANGHYYATRDPLGVDGDFTTAPEISQMFGELIGLWCADMWLRGHAGQPVAFVELGGGRGTLAADALRSMARFTLFPQVHMVETSPVLRDLQAVAVPQAHFHDQVATLPADMPLIVIANELFDALPIRQLVRTARGWREQMVVHHGGTFATVAGDVPMDAAVPAPLAEAGEGAIIETSPAACAIMQDIAIRIAAQGGAFLAIDYGYVTTRLGYSLQAVKAHGHSDPMTQVGEQDLTAHVDFSALAAAARAGGANVYGPVEQGDFLNALGLSQRTEALMTSHPERADALAAERDRLAADSGMGSLFKVMAITAPHWPKPEGF